MTPTTIQECSIQLCEAKQRVKEIVQNSFPQRDKEQREQIKTLSASPFKSDKKHSKILRELQKAKNIKQLFRKLKALQVNERQGVTRIKIPLQLIRSRVRNGGKLKFQQKFFTSYNRWQ